MRPSRRHVSLRALTPALTAILALSALLPIATPARAALPPMGVPLPALLRADPALSGGLSLAGAVRRAATASAGSAALAIAAHTGSIVQMRSERWVAVHRSPGGRVVETLGALSDTLSQPRAFTVYRLGPGGWLGVSVPALHGRLGWIRADPAILFARPATQEIHVSLRRRILTLLRYGRVVMRSPVVIGAPDSPTPVGHFSVDDKRRFAPADPAYGIGALALSVPPQGRPWMQWRVAIHGLDGLGRLGGTGSLGCVHVPTSALARLLRAVPVGTPVNITR